MHNLTKEQKALLSKLIDFNTLWEYDSKEIRHSLYKLFFNTREKDLKEYIDELGKRHDAERKKHEKKDAKAKAAEEKDGKAKGEGEDAEDKKESSKDTASKEKDLKKKKEN